MLQSRVAYLSGMLLCLLGEVFGHDAQAGRNCFDGYDALRH